MLPARFALGKIIAPIAKPSTHVAGSALLPSKTDAVHFSFDKLSTHVAGSALLPSKTDAVHFSFDKLSTYENLDKFGLHIDCRIGRDAITSRPIKSLVLEPTKFNLRAPFSIEVQPFLICLEAIRIFGVNYKHRIWQEIKLALNDEPIRVKQENKMRAFTKSYDEPEQLFHSGKKPKPKVPSFWDLIYPLLQPPLILEQIENLYLPHDLYPFQKTGITFLMDNESALLADEMGTGKTVQTAVALRLLMQKARAHFALVICPLAVLRQWDEHLRDWAPELAVTVVRGNPQTRALDWSMPAHIYITTYDTLRKDVDEDVLPRESFGKFDIIVLDEAQYIKNKNSGRAKVIRKFKARQRWALTGTPIENKIEDIDSIFDFLRPNYLTPYDLYPAGLRKKISPYFLRRLKKDVLKDLPPKIRQEFWLELDSNQRKAYDSVLSQGQAELRELGEKVNKTHIFLVLNKLKQICNFAPEKDSSPKLGLLIEQIETIVESDQKVIVFSQYLSEGVEKIEASVKQYGVSKVIGGQSDRDFQVKQFQKTKNTSILIALQIQSKKKFFKL